MTPEQLKASILQYAMEGKLVKQNLNDISAIQNLKEAREKIKEAIKNKELRKEKYTQAENNGKLPKNWGVARLKEICEKNNSSIKRGPFGSSITKSMFVPKGKDTYKVYEQGNAIRRDINYGSYYITKDKFESLSAFQVKTGDIIVSCAGTIGKTFILPPKIEPGIINQALLKLTLDTSIIDKKFFLLEFESISVQLNLHAKGSAIKNLASLKYLKNKVDFPLPPIEEQKRIVAKIEKLMPLVDEYAESYNRLQKIDNEFEDKLKQSVLQYAMEGKLVKQDPSDEPASELVKASSMEKSHNESYKIPSSWEWIRLGSGVKFINGRAYKKTELLTDSNLTPVLRVGNLFTNSSWYYSDLKLDEDKYIDNGDLIYAWSASFGPRIWNGGHVIYHYHIWKTVIKKSIDKKFLYYFLSDPHNVLGETKLHGSTMKHVTKTNMEKLPFPLPPLEEQKRIVAKIEKIMNSINNH